MSGAQRSLHNRTLPPLLPNNGATGGTATTGPKPSGTKVGKATKPAPHYNKGAKYMVPLNAGRGSGGLSNHMTKTSGSKSHDLTADMVTLFLREQPEFLEKFVLENVSSEKLAKWASTKSHLKQDKRTLLEEPGSTATQRLALERPNTSTRKALMERSRLLRELTRDINSQPNKSRILSELKDCIATAVSADGANLYLVDDSEENVYFYNSKADNSKEDSPCVLKIGKGSTISAFVADTKESERVDDICADDRFPDGIPISSGMVQSVLVQPILQEDGRVAGVIELYRAVGKPPFLAEDEEIVTSYLVWGGLAVMCSEMYHRNIKQQRLNQFILEVTQSMFGKFKSMEYVIKDIMIYAKDLVKADRASLFLVDKDTHEIYSSIFDAGSFDKCEFVTKDVVIRFPMDRGIAGHVATTSETLTIFDAYSDSRFNREIDQQTGYVTKTILCMPVKLQEEVIGVVQMLNKIGGSFTREDESHFKTFATYCGLALHIAKMYEKIRRSEQKYKVALEVLSYHSQYTDEELNKLKSVENYEVPGITEIYFSPWSIDEFHKPLAVIYMFGDLFGLQRFDRETLMKFTLTVRKNYRKVPYHNWAHAFSVAHAMYTIIKQAKHKFTTEECLALYVGSLCHDLDHRGKTNQFMVKSAAPLAAIYSTSTMEHHHFNMTVAILQRSGHNIFKHLSSDNYKRVLGNIKHCILATDLAKFFDYKVRLESTLSVRNFDWDNEDHRLILMAVSMTTCDLCSMYKPWKIQLGLVMVIMEEFWIQGDEEKTQGQTPIRMMDRDYKHELPDSQVGFIKGICLPCYSLLTRVLPEVQPMADGAQRNLSQWESMSKLDREAKEAKFVELEQSLRSDNGEGPVLNMT